MPTKPPKTVVNPSAKSKATASKKTSAKAGEHSLEGQPAPAFSLKAQNGATLSLEDLIAEGVLVLYFYPKDLTPGCTTQACSFRDNLSAVREAGATVVGVSGDTSTLHDRFIAKHELNFPLLSDTDNKVAKAYGVYKKKSLYGREFMGIERTTFVIDREGVIRRVFPKVKVDGHTEEILTALNQLT